jgi:hypothetical protein
MPTHDEIPTNVHEMSGEADSKDRIRNLYKNRPTLDEIVIWIREGYSKATDGCITEPDGYCIHECPSWLIELDLI